MDHYYKRRFKNLCLIISTTRSSCRLHMLITFSLKGCYMFLVLCMISNFGSYPRHVHIMLWDFLLLTFSGECWFCLFVCLLAYFSRQLTKLGSDHSPDPPAGCGSCVNLVVTAFLYYLAYLCMPIQGSVGDLGDGLSCSVNAAVCCLWWSFLCHSSWWAQYFIHRLKESLFPVNSSLWIPPHLLWLLWVPFHGSAYKTVVLASMHNNELPETGSTSGKSRKTEEPAGSLLLELLHQMPPSLLLFLPLPWKCYFLGHA